MRKAIYAGSFDPFTKGHMDIVEQALMIFDNVIVAIGDNPRKSRLFSIEETLPMIRETMSLHLGTDAPRIQVTTFNNALVRYAEEQKASAIVRGLRQVSDFNDEFIQNGINSRLTDIPITYFICATEFLHVSSSSVKEMARYGLDTDWLVDPHVVAALAAKFAQ
jgi:pantetheine-phosphate adenylyltransferase